MTATAATRRTTRRSRVEPEPVPELTVAPETEDLIATRSALAFGQGYDLALVSRPEPRPENRYDTTFGVGNGRAYKPELSQEPMMIGLADGDRDMINCPVCGRRLGPSSTRCPGCSTRLLLGVHLKRASVFLGIGIATGLLVGGAMTAMVTSGLRSAAPIESLPMASAQPTLSPAPTLAASPTVAPATPGAVTTAQVNALQQSADITARLTARGADLRALIDAPTLDTHAVARILRSTATDAANGATIAPRLASWPAAEEVSRLLATFHSDTAELARSALRASLVFPDAYRASGEKMLVLFDGLGAIDAMTQAVAGDAGLKLRP